MEIQNLLLTATFMLTGLTFSASHADGKTIKVACVGDSITFGATIKDRNNDSYPAQLQRLLGNDYQVKNFGVSGTTMLSKGNAPWTKTGAAKNADKFQPDVVVIKLGTNDSKAKNWKFKAEFQQDTINLVEHFKSLPSHPRVILCTPVPGTRPENSKNPNEITQKGVKETVPLVRQAAKETSSELIDLNTEFTFFEGELKSILPDGIHPKAKGAAHIALRVADQLLMPHEKSIDIEAKLKAKKITAKKGAFHGYSSYQFKLPAADNTSCTIVVPKNAIKGAPWIWRARFFGHQPALDQALLDRGYYLAFCNIADLFGSPAAVKRWDAFYALSQELGFSAKPILEGMSRGGLIIFNWAKANPGKVAAIYGDNPVCDIRSWPMKKSKPDWQKCQKVWNLKDSDLAGFEGNAFDELDVLSKVNVPVFLVLGKKDDVVPLEENSYILAKRYTKLGGAINVWEKPNGGHHPHGLHPVFPLLRHLLHATGNPISPKLYQRAETQTFPTAQESVKKKWQDLIAESSRILILGDSITYAGGYVSDFETWLSRQPFGKDKEVLNLGLPSETVSGLSEKGHAGGRFPRPDLHTRLDSVLAKTRPDLILACYGMNCGVYRPVSKERFDAYKAGILKLKTKAEKAGAHIIFVTPPYYDDHGKTKPGGFNYADTLATYAQWLVSQRKNGWDVIDLNSEMTSVIHAWQVIDPKVTFQRDHVHPNTAGHRIMAQSLIDWFASANTAPTEQLIHQIEIPAGLNSLMNQRMRLLRDAWLTETKHSRPGIKPGLPMDQAKKKSSELTQKIKGL